MGDTRPLKEVGYLKGWHLITLDRIAILLGVGQPAPQPYLSGSVISCTANLLSKGLENIYP